MVPTRNTLVAALALALGACAAEPASSSSSLDEAVAPAQRSLPLASHPAVAALNVQSRTALERSPVPMLVLPASYANGTLVMTGERWTALSYRDDQLTISLHVTNYWHEQLEDGEQLYQPTPQTTVRGQPAYQTVNEAIRSLAWNEGESAYALEVECAAPETDTRCTESEFIATLAESLIAAHRDAQ